ncbi:hypothetical protein R6U79_09955 [Pseudomonas putida]|uniref:hypothetical protein n=1 Tax=Pseudomonas putida TaxID=303 RepID=UPI0029DE5C7D|nr:hypothetical protein [Pseudomonas putida]WPK02547.1 hypothetical protein R6U79_09955 [Pseudomonas putida]
MLTSRDRNVKVKLAIAFRLTVAALFFQLAGLAPPVSHADEYLGPSEVIHLVSQQLAEGGIALHTELERLGLGAEIEILQRYTGDSLNSFSAQSMLENLYQRAEHHQTGEGQRFIAILLNEQAKHSAIIASAPQLKSLLDQYPAARLNVQQHGLTFSSPEHFKPTVPQKPLPAIVQRGVATLTNIYADQGLSELRLITLKTFQKEGYDKAAFDKVILENPGKPDEALRKLLDIGTPKPTVEKAIHSLLGQTLERSAALSADTSIHSIMEALSSELTTEQRNYLQAEDRLESRQLQLAQARAANRPGNVPPSDREKLISSIQQLPQKDMTAALKGKAEPVTFNGFLAANEVIDPKSTAEYVNYLKDTFEPSNDAPSAGQSGSGQPSDAPPPRSEPTPRAFTKARFSARAGRGVSVGAKVDVRIEQTPVNAVWLTNAEDSRFGRLFVTFRNSPTSQSVAASRILFADSFYSAYSVISTPQGSPSAFRDGDILVLMSMTDGDFAQKRLTFIHDVMRRPGFLESAIFELDDTQQAKLLQTIEAIKSTTYPKPSDDALVEILLKNEKIKELLNIGAQRAVARAITEDPEQIMQATLRTIVIHPALHGRELAWSATRVDFWSNQIQQLKQESMLQNGGIAAPAELNDITTQGSSTWQYYEKDSIISMRASNQKASDLVVTSDPTSTTPVSERSHFRVAMFNEKNGTHGTPAEDNLYLRPDISENFQPLLDWLSTNHHDFIRLNDFSEAFSLLRWLTSKETTVQIIDIGLKASPLVTPDQTDITKGPLVDAQ